MNTPEQIVANTSRIVTTVCDRLTSNRANFPQLVSFGVKFALEKFGIPSDIVFGKAAWIEIEADGHPRWAGYWKDRPHLWVNTSRGEVVDLNTFVSNRVDGVTKENEYSSPLLWSNEVPRFYLYDAEGIAEVEAKDTKHRQWIETLKAEILEDCEFSGSSDQAKVESTSFPNEPMLCSNRKLLDDSENSFRFFDRALSVWNLPEAPFQATSPFLSLADREDLRRTPGRSPDRPLSSRDDRKGITRAEPPESKPL